MPAPSKKSHSPLQTKFIIAGAGFFLSIVLHELVHFILHIHQTVGVVFFPDWFTVAELVVNLPPGYDLDSEEFIAYGISAVVLIVTAILIAKVHDDTDNRTVTQMIFPRTTPHRTNTSSTNHSRSSR